jgi:nitrogen fixation protein FixH
MTASPSAPRVPFTVKGWHVAAGVVAFFAIVIGVDAAFLTLAYRTHPGQVAARPYEAGLIYNAELERQRAQEALGWRAGRRGARRMASGAAAGSRRQAVEGPEVTATLLRPATEQGRTS